MQIPSSTATTLRGALCWASSTTTVSGRPLLPCSSQRSQCSSSGLTAQPTGPSQADILREPVICAHAGALAQYLTLPASNLLEVPEGITDEEAAFAEPLAAACRITEQEVRFC